MTSDPVTISVRRISFQTRLLPIRFPCRWAREAAVIYELLSHHQRSQAAVEDEPETGADDCRREEGNWRMCVAPSSGRMKSSCVP